MGTSARAWVGRESPSVANPIADERHHPVRGACEDDVTRFPSLHRHTIPQDLHLDMFGKDVKRAGRALISGCAGLVAAIGLDDSRAQVLFDLVPLKREKHLAEYLRERHQGPRSPGGHQLGMASQLNNR
jgi:hypothetical protein